MYVFGGDYGYKKEEDVRDQHINELSAGSLRDDNMDCDLRNMICYYSGRSKVLRKMRM